MKKLLLTFLAVTILLIGILILPNNSSAQSISINGCANLTRSLFFGSRGNDVSILQQFLKDKGYFSGSPTGYFGSLTYRSVVSWQKSQGISAIGIAGPATRNRISQLCGGQNYNDDSTPVYNFQPSASCTTWFDGCNTCSRNDQNSPSACTLMYCFAAGKGYCKSHFDNSNNNNLPPVISSFSGPTTLNINMSGTWSVNATDPENRQLTYSILWGDEQNYFAPASANLNFQNSFTQTTTFTHTYSRTGTFTISISVTDNLGLVARTTSTVLVTNNNIVCTMEYAPVCGQPPVPSCRYDTPACMIATPGPKTYSNSCMLNADGARLLYNGACNNGY